MVTISHMLHALVCDECGSMRELRGRNAEQHVIAADAFRRRHRCRTPQTESPTPADRWSSLFSNIKF